MLRLSLIGVQLSKRGLLAVLVPSFIFLSWYYIFSVDLLNFVALGAFSYYNAFFNFLASLMLLPASFVVRRSDKVSVVYAWSILSAVGTIILILAPAVVRLAIFSLLGAVFGMGALAFLTYFWDVTVPEERGRVAGFIAAVFLPVFPLMYALVKSLDFFGVAMVCISLNLGCLTIGLLDAKKSSMRTKDRRKYTPEKRIVLLYSIPWLIYSLTNVTFARAVSLHVSQSLPFFSLAPLYYMEVVAGAFGAMMGGLIADFVGRRVAIALGLISYGASSAISGLATGYNVFCMSHIGIGLAWGILLTMYLFVIWGDLANVMTRSHRYSVGLAIFHLASGTGALLVPQLFQVSLTAASIASCLLIFLSHIPLIMTPELLSSAFRDEIRLKSYIYLVSRKKMT